MTRGIVIIISVFLLNACMSATPREGKPVDVDTPQAAEQCKAQPWLDWCPK